MKNQKLRIEYIYHSGFSIEFPDKLLIFDYYRGPVHLKKDKPTYVFSSHAHADHFNPEIFQWQKEQPDIHYILSSDIQPQISSPQGKDNLTLISPYEEKQIDNLHIKTYNSTDQGVSFLIEYAGVRIFHAGDLNWWYWWGESEAEREKATVGFKAEMAKIKGEDIDIAFFPVDPRLEHNYSLGAEFFIQEIQPKILIPMHFGLEVKPIHEFAIKMKNSTTKIIEMIQSGEEVIL